MAITPDDLPPMQRSSTPRVLHWKQVDGPVLAEPAVAVLRDAAARR